jgi:quercetin dioxygenase-like cupin family protein
MAEETGAMKHGVAGIPADNLERKLVFAQPNADPKLVHIGVVGDTYTILLASKDTAGRFCLIDTHIPPGGGPPPHRHDFEETFSVLEGELEATFRGAKQIVRAGETIHTGRCSESNAHNKIKKS